MIDDPRILPGEALMLTVDGEPIGAHRGQTVAAVLLAAGRRTLRATRIGGRPRGMYCAMGTCYDCVVTVNGQSGVRACMTRVEQGMRIATPARFAPYVPRP